MKQQFVVTHTLCQTEIRALPHSELKTHRLSKCRVHKKKIDPPHIFIQTNMLMYLSIYDLSGSCLSPVQLLIGGLRQIAISWR